MTMVKATANEPEVAMSSGVRSSPPSSLLFLRSATRGKGRGVVGQGRCAGGPGMTAHGMRAAGANTEKKVEKKPNVAAQKACRRPHHDQARSTGKEGGAREAGGQRGGGGGREVAGERGGTHVHVRLREVRDDAIKHDGEEHGRLVLLVDRYGKDAAKDIFRPLRVHALALERLVERGHLGLEKRVFLGRHDESGALNEGGARGRGGGL